jgi:hypothetical protein
MSLSHWLIILVTVITESYRNVTEVSGVMNDSLQFAGTVEESDTLLLHESI